VRFRDEWLNAKDGTKLYLTSAELLVPIRARVLLTHGRGEHIGRYGHVAEVFSKRGIQLCSYDLRGHGRSSGRRGDVLAYSMFLEDLRQVSGRFGGADAAPLFQMGHSFGGQILLNYLLDSREAQPQGAIVTSPYLRLAFTPPKWRLALAMVMRWLCPGAIQETTISGPLLSSDEAHLASLPDPHLTHQRISARMFFAMESGAASALQRAREFTAPILLVHGGRDEVTSAAATREFFERCGSADKRLIIHPEMRHETHNEAGREEVLANLCDWIEERL
jgi:alpha-beta hydrolase superfamily lysophospholipase